MGVQIEWVPARKDKEASLLVTPDLVFRAAGKTCVDALAGAAASEALERGVVRSFPRTDEWGAIAAQMRLRARRALNDCLGVDAGEAKRPPKIRAASRPSQYSWTAVSGGSWLCSSCGFLAHGSRA